MNPVHTRQAERAKAERAKLRAQAGSFLTVLQSWKDATHPNLAKTTVGQHNREIDKHIVPAFKGKAVEAVTRMDISALLKRVEVSAPEVAKNLRNYLAGIFEHAIELGLIDANPVPSRRLMKPRSSVSHPALPIERVPAFLDAVDSSTATLWTRTAMHLVILSACRKTEVCGARWSEFDLDAGEWTIPAERMKARREHWVPLPRQAVAMLRQLRGCAGGEFLFPHRLKRDAPLSERALNELLGRIGFEGESIHGFRSVFSTHFNALGRSADVIERCLAHVPFDKVRRVYNRHEYKDERRALLQEWADWLDAQRVANKQQHKIAA